ncbi:hypothetical protein ACFSR9_11875 [Deinococcus taklimakanensis]|uniref:Uncharacterized protein n=1 Tax=Deinococcus taklimakanensis TaxID=536443 RepID=A0ABW5P6N7_9DEIO
MNSLPIESPAEWDAFLNTCDDPIRLVEQLRDPQDALTARRYLASATATRCPEAIAQALEEVKGKHSGLTGARLMALGQLGQPEVIQAAPLEASPEISPLALEDCCDQALARGMAARTLRNFGEAHAQLSIALFLARALKMLHREQHVMLELGQVLTVQGRPDPALLEQALSMPIATTSRRRAYGAQALAEACIALGDYRRGRKLVTQPEGVQPDLWAFANALIGDRVSADIEVRDGPYVHLADAIWAIRDHREVSMPPLTPNSPEAEYGALLRGIAMLQSRPMVRQARRVFESLTAVTPDQRVWQLAGRIHAAALDPGDEDVVALMLDFRQALDSLRSREYLPPLLRALMPEASMLLGLLPHAHPDIEDGLTELPLLTGECLTYQFTQRKLPGKAAGSALWVQAAATGERVTVHRQARERVVSALEALGHNSVVNLGVALRALSGLRQAAGSGEQALWTDALTRAMDWVDSDVLRSDLRRELM